MSARIERLIEDELIRIPPHHPDRQLLVSYADSLHLFNVEHEASLTPHELVQREAYEWQRFFGERIAVQNPPKELIETRQRVREVGLNDFVAVYIPETRMSRRIAQPGYKTKLPEDFWDLNAEYKDLGMSSTQEVWMLVDTTKRPHYSRGMQSYDHDGLHDTIDALREEGRVGAIIRGDYMLPQGSRFGVTREELYKVIYPEIAHKVRVAPEQIRSLTCIENNLLGNRTFSEFGLDTTSEWLHGVTPNGSGFVGGMSEIVEMPKGKRARQVGFRPAIVFS